MEYTLNVVTFSAVFLMGFVVGSMVVERRERKLREIERSMRDLERYEDRET